jgi:hypothetical protein
MAFLFHRLAIMKERDMTADELERFEDEIVHHETEKPGPASEPDVQDKRPPEMPIPPNPD